MAKKHKGGEHGEIHADERWLITYADMITLLLAVFIVMYALSDTNLRKFNAFAQSLNAAFSTDVMSGSSQFTVTEGQATTPDAGRSNAALGMIGSEAQTVQTVVKNYAIQKGLETSLEVVSAANGIGLQIKGPLLFEAGRASLNQSAESTATLDMLVAVAMDWVKNVDRGQIRVEGNTDSNPVSGPFYADNWELSAARAMTVLHYLKDAGVDPDRLSMQGNGSTNPLPSTPSTSADNRRVVVWMLSPDTTSTASPTPAIESIAPTTPSYAPFGG